jgi:hemerythrin-like domain-containing protein
MRTGSFVFDREKGRVKKRWEGVMENLNPIKVLLSEHEEITKDIDILQDRVERVLRQAQDKTLSLTLNEQELDEMRELARCLHNKIRSHFYKEEQALFQVMEDNLFDRRCTTIMRDEHKEILEHGFQLLGIFGNWKDNLWDPEKISGLQHLLFEFINSFKSHIRREEQILYPMAQICLNEEQIKEIGRRVKS